MSTKKEVLEAVFEAIDEINAESPPDRQLAKSADTILFGKSGKLDSLGLVRLIVATEQKIEERFKVAVTIADEKAMAQKHSPFRTVSTLADFIVTLLPAQTL